VLTRLSYKIWFCKGLSDNDKFYHVVDNYTLVQALLPNAVIYDASTEFGLRMNASNQNAIIISYIRKLAFIRR
jgi:hypothetical protein